MKALVLIDIQNDFLPGGALPVPEGDAIIPVVNRLLNYFEVVVATQDWHPAGHKSFASNHIGKQPFDVINLHGIQQTLWPDHCVQGTSGADFPSKLNSKPVQAIFRKGTHVDIDSYSGFYDNDHRLSTGLAGFLREKKVESIYLVGLAGDVCVHATAMDSLEEGFKTYIIEDGTRPLNNDHFSSLMHEFTANGGMIIQSNEKER
jgi:nicotinamidase/pyrazinamidase